MALDLEELYEAMAGAASGAFKGTWKGVKDYTLPELRKLAATFVDIELGLKSRPRVYTRTTSASRRARRLASSATTIRFCARSD